MWSICSQSGPCTTREMAGREAGPKENPRYQGEIQNHLLGGNPNLPGYLSLERRELWVLRLSTVAGSRAQALPSPPTWSSPHWDDTGRNGRQCTWVFTLRNLSSTLTSSMPWVTYFSTSFLICKAGMLRIIMISWTRVRIKEVVIAVNTIYSKYLMFINYLKPKKVLGCSRPYV